MTTLRLSLSTDVLPNTSPFNFDPMGILESVTLRSKGQPVRLAPFAPQFVVVGKETLITEVLQNPTLFDKNGERPGSVYALLTQRYLPSDAGGVLYGGSFTQNDPAVLHRQRKVLRKYLSPARLGDVAIEALTYITDHMLDWREDKNVDVLEAFKGASLAALTHHLFGGKVDSETTARIATILPQYFKKMAMQLILGQAPTRNLTGWKSYEDLGKEFVGITNALIDRALEDRETFADTLLGDLIEEFGEATPHGFCLSQENQRIVVGTIGTIYLAGFDSTAVVATHACLTLAKDLALQDQLVEEFGTVFPDGVIRPEKFSELPLLEAFWRWQLHEHPAFRIIFRNVTRDCKLGGVKLKKDDQLLIMIHGAHMQEGNRLTMNDFLNASNKEELKGSLPFGRGTRICPGEAMARELAFAMLIPVLRRYVLKPAYSHRTKTRRSVGMTSPPRKKVGVTSR